LLIVCRQGEQTFVFRFRLQQTNGSFPFPFAANKRKFPFPFAANKLKISVSVFRLQQTNQVAEYR
jgi:hypothetical protein